MTCNGGVPFGGCKKITGSQHHPGGRRRKHTQPPAWRRDAHCVPDQATARDALALARVNLGSWNIRSGLECNTDKIQALVHWAGLLNL
jgi:hypothetical protein